MEGKQPNDDNDITPILKHEFYANLSGLVKKRGLYATDNIEDDSESCTMESNNYVFIKDIILTKEMNSVALQP